MQKFTYVVLILLFSASAKAQHKTEPEPASTFTSIIGVVTNNPDDFYAIKNLLATTPGIEVIDYCYKDKLFNIVVNPDFFKEDAAVFDLIKSYFVDAQCYRKNMDKEKYFKLCNEELLKQNKSTL